MKWRSVDLSWTKCSDSTFNWYKLYRSTDPDFTPGDANSTYLDRGSDETSREKVAYPDSGLTPSTTYYYVLRTSHAGVETDSNKLKVTTADPATPVVEFKNSDGTDQLARACAGGVSVDGVHSFTITGTAKREDGTLVTNEPFKFTFENNKGHDYSDAPADVMPTGWTMQQMKKAKYVIRDGQGYVVDLVEELTRSTDAEGKVSVEVLSSDISSSDIKVKVKWKSPQVTNAEEKDAGDKDCDFGALISKRRFPVDYEEEADRGWKFGDVNLLLAPSLADPGSYTPGKIYLKFEVDQSKDENYIDPVTLRGNWRFVNGHRLKFRITKVKLADDTEVTDETKIKEYAFIVVNPQDTVPTTALVETSGDGAAQRYIKAGTKIAQAARIYIRADDGSQWPD